ncbi:hypothetical protein RHMOL_Rhmol05G0038300 [Rhododendron molle]|uniref:Uncharacterized protein n=1 Tax=Rhododendron molle TaxID=49168 RepID=A0ACC0NLN6_RHOML|nr:hypothetical protein RHMOL_Rhmol05G0038300 [Rhododendron molle]
MCAADGSDLVSAMNNSRLLIVEMRSKPSNAQCDGSEVRTNSKSKSHRVSKGNHILAHSFPPCKRVNIVSMLGGG